MTHPSKGDFLKRHLGEIWQQFEISKLPLDRFLAQYYQKRRHLGASDRRFLSEQVYTRVRAMPWPVWLMPYYKPVYDQEAPITLRVNTLKGDRNTLKRELEARGIRSHDTPLSPDGLILDKRYPLQGLDLFRQGYFEVQDEGSQLISHFLHPKPGDHVLDACAGAGGKTLHLAALMHNRGKIVAMDSDTRKLAELRKRAVRAGANNIDIYPPLRSKEVPVGKNGGRGDFGNWDAVLIDAPCTGVGTMRRNPDLRLRLESAQLAAHTKLQMEILSHHARAVKPGGVLVYATCSFLPAENADLVKNFLSKFPDYREQAFLRIDPEKYSGDGFFAARLTRGC